MEAALHHQNESAELTETPRGHLIKKKFTVALASGFLSLAILIAIFGTSGVAYAMPIGGIGDFYVTFDKLVGKGFTFFPKIGETGNQKASPMARNKIDDVTVYNLHIYKDIKLPTGNVIRLNITASKPVTIKGLIQDAKDIQGDFSFNKLALTEHNSSDFTKEFGQSASNITIKNGKIQTDYLFQNMVTLNGLHIYISHPTTSK